MSVEKDMKKLPACPVETDVYKRQVFDNPLHPYTQGLFGSIPSLDKDVDRLSPIPGLMPDPANLPEGCKFCTRCDRVCDSCKTEAVSYTHLMVDGKLKHLFIPLAAFGAPVELPEEFLRAENPFTV